MRLFSSLAPAIWMATIITAIEMPSSPLREADDPIPLKASVKGEGEVVVIVVVVVAAVVG